MASKGRFHWGFVALAVVLAGLIAWLTLGGKKPGKAPPAPVVAVATAKVTVRDFPMVVTALGSAQAWQGVLIRAQVNGRLMSVPVAEGSEVKAGQVVAEIDPSAYRATLMQAQGALHRDEAQLEAARIDLARYQKLAAQDSIAKQQVDTQAALVKQLEGTVMVDKGSVEAATVNLNFTRIKSPVTGRVGVRLVDPGNLVSTTDTTGIISINEVTPIAVTFTIPEGDFERLATASDGFRKPLLTQALSQETNLPIGQGQLMVADNHVDQSTGTVQMKAKFANDKRSLWPGQFVNVRLTVQTLPHALTVPSTAINQGPNGPFVFVVNNDKAMVHQVSVIATQDATAVIRTGLQAGDTVVTDGQLSLRPGSKVRMRAERPQGGAAAGGPAGGKRPPS
ncbi:MAG: efflux transporter periplasmic adaptor subunit [Caulobacteraceae bacterium]|jgi:multidrug efflux system membrane fusion protein|nr:efflux transporter periplasmic adaptor subunit [Caulobacteraceae bacterium]